LQADDRFAVRFVPCREKTLRFFLIARAKARLFFGGGILDEIASAFSPEESELLHGWSPIPDRNRSPQNP
jgi:hypothetical protein